MSMVRFDEALPNAIRGIHDRCGEQQDAHIVRDVVGKITVILPDDAPAVQEGSRRETAEYLHGTLGAYSAGGSRVLLTHSELIDPDDILASPDRIRVDLDQAKPKNIWFIDRMLTNQDWLRAPLGGPLPVPTATAYGIKGGVGRTTALAVWAWHVARAGKRVFVVDLDLEAPGIGGMLLSEPYDFGLVDWLVENQVGQAGEDMLRESLVPAPIADDCVGSVHVLPAFGARSEGYVAKVGRIYLPTLDQEGRLAGLAEHLKQLLDMLSVLDSRPDLVLLDARAGLHDIGAAAVTRLGAETLIFGRDEKQSWMALRQLFLHLKHANSIQWGMPATDLRWRMKMVAAQTNPRESDRRRWIGHSYDVWTELYDDEAGEEESAEHASVFSIDDDGPHYPLFIDFDTRLRTLDLVDKQERPDWDSAIWPAFSSFLTGATERLLGDQVARGEP